MVYVFALLTAITIGALVYMASRNYANIDIYYWCIVLYIPVIMLGYTFEVGASDAPEAHLALCFIYLESTVLVLFVLLSMMKNFGMRVMTGYKIGAYMLCIAHLACVWICKNNTLYYATFEIKKTPLGTVVMTTDGPLKIIHYIYLAIIFVGFVGNYIFVLIKKKNSSRKMLFSYGMFISLGTLFYILEITSDFDFSFLPFLYVIVDVGIAMQYEKIHSHNMDGIVSEQKKEHSDIGYVAFDNQKRLLCYNECALKYVPELEGKRIDAVFEKTDVRLREVLYSLLDYYDKTGEASGGYEMNGTNFQCVVSPFVMHKGGRRAGYLVELRDVTAEQGYMNLIREYSKSLQTDVDEKTKHIRYIQQRIVLGMATIIENRDLNTGGHVRRTSDIIKILVDEMRRQNVGDVDEAFADEIIRSAPMHDLGKIAIDSRILNKEGKLTDEEYKIMKTHSAKSGEIVQAILAGVEEPHFVQTAYQLARFHHERWDGKGYPERLSQYEIPLEARIMAVADVYDAIVSKRCYKGPMSFETAAEIMLEGMGTQFDPMMKPIFEGCRKQLEQYYIDNREE